jgi:hypothetical protein
MPATIPEEIVVGGQPGDFCTVRHRGNPPQLDSTLRDARPVERARV